MYWLLLLGAAWALLAVPLALFVGGAVRCADRVERRQLRVSAPDLVPAHWSATADAN